MKTKISLLLILIIGQVFFISCKDKAAEQKSNQSTNVIEDGPLAPQQLKVPEEEEFLRNACLEGNLEAVNEMLARNVDVNAIDAEGRTALMFAAYNGHIDIIKSLNEKSLKFNLQDYSGRSALMYASSGKFPETVKFLLKKEADPNLVDSEEHFTALMYAAAEGNIEVVKILLSNKADPNLLDIDGESAELFASTNGHTKVAEILKNASTK